MNKKTHIQATPTYFGADANLYPYVSHHRDAIEANYVIDPDFVHQDLLRRTSEKTVVFVCFSNRSGSNLLLDTLERIGFGCTAGDEFFNAEAIHDHAREFEFETFEDHLDFVIRLRSPRKNVFLKIGAHQLFWFANSGLIARYFKNARYVLIEREDRIAQAVSLYLADQTGSYLRTVDADAVDRAPIVYSAEAILKRLKHVMDVTSLFEYFFAIHTVPCHRVLYEDLDADPVRTIQTMSAALSIGDDFPLRWEVVLQKRSAGILRQADKLNREFAERFRRQFDLNRAGQGSQGGKSDTDG